MIGRLAGKLLSKQPPLLLLDVNGVGYEIEAPMSTFYQLPAIGNEIVLHTHLVVREDAWLLCGFATEPERRMFRDLIKVNGVGAKLALAILSGISAEDFAHCVQENDTSSLTRLPGVGKKTAERLIIEMRDRLKAWSEDGVVTTMPAHIEGAAPAGKEAVSALVALGYKPQEASRMVGAVRSEGLTTSEDLIKAALKSAVN
ncbi:MAG: Holliday junction branch migration protein RuvA [Gammaproteobacteria bacterium]|nr:Holliday junction branch migration protein RuvA [Gammaproteobacteria bacterium]MDH5776692.1 Holliday junction branch migration protein RuvA [Gammaproteobacteria bacterium]